MGLQGLAHVGLSMMLSCPFAVIAVLSASARAHEDSFSKIVALDTASPIDLRCLFGRMWNAERCGSAPRALVRKMPRLASPCSRQTIRRNHPRRRSDCRPCSAVRSRSRGEPRQGRMPNSRVRYGSGQVDQSSSRQDRRYQGNQCTRSAQGA